MIQDALTRGEIDAETALIYEVFADFNDSRLPSRYHGEDPQVPDSLILAVVLEKYDHLSRAAQETLAPFLIPPIYRGSWYDLRKRSAKGESITPLQLTPPLPPLDQCKEVSDDWDFVDAPDLPVRVWWEIHKDSRAKAEQVIADLRLSWNKLTNLLGAPLPDNGSKWACRGGTDDLDIQFIDGNTSYTPGYPGDPVGGNPGCPARPAYIELARDSSAWVVAHELAHVLQWRRGICEEKIWLAEATATWAVDFVGFPDNPEHYSARKFLQYPFLPLNVRAYEHEYGAYLFFQYLTKTIGKDELIRTIWDATVEKDSLAAVNDSIPGGFETQWPEFALAAWNTGPEYDKFRQWDQLQTGAQTYESAVDTPGGDPDYVMPAVVMPLAADYNTFKFYDTSGKEREDVRSVIWGNGITFRIYTDDLRINVRSERPPEEKRKGAKVHAFLKFEGSDTWTKEDWTEKAAVSFCRDIKNERLRELVIIVSNSDYKNPKHVLAPAEGDLFPRLAVSNIGCWRYVGTVTTTRTSEGITQRAVANVTWTRTCYLVNEPVACREREYVASVGLDATGSVNYSISGKSTDERACTFSGSAEIPIGPIQWTNLRSFLRLETLAAKNSADYRAYWGRGVLWHMVEGIESPFEGAEAGTCSERCPYDDPDDPPPPHACTVWGWWEMPRDYTFRVSADGSIVGGYQTEKVNASWNFRPARQ